MKSNLLNLGIRDVVEAIQQMGEPKYRADQILRWIYQSLITSASGGFDEMTNLPVQLRESLKEQFYIGSLKIIRQVNSNKGKTTKFLFELSDGKKIESVFLLDGKRRTICLSSQVGCKLACKFCATGHLGFVRNLTSGEILEQIIQIGKIHGKPCNLVFMGMGEPLLNLPEIEKALIVINSSKGLGIGARKITISTSGIVPGIKTLADLNLQVNLALSLNATRDELRSQLMPVNRSYPISEVLEACRDYAHRTKRQITLEYVLIKDINLSDRDAAELAKIAHSLPASVNLISYNPVTGEDFKSPSSYEVRAFKEELKRRGVEAKIRYRRGRDIKAGCGQLTGT